MDFYITPEEYEQAAKNGISAQRLEVRIRSFAWSKEKAVHTPPQKKKPRIPKEFMDLAEKNGIPYNTLRDRVHNRGWSYEKAATTPREDKKKKADFAREHCRKYPPEILELIKRNNINYNTFRQRLRSGWSMEEAATKPTMTSREIGLMMKDKRQPKRRRA